MPARRGPARGRDRGLRLDALPGGRLPPGPSRTRLPPEPGARLDFSLRRRRD